MKTFQKGDLEIKYKVEGDSGPVYVLLHGFGGGHHDWRELAAHLAVSNRVVMPNLKVFFSHEEPLTFSRQVDLLQDFIKSIYEQKGVHVLNIIGQSYGATLSLGLRVQNKFNVDKHILLNPMPFFPLRSVRDRNVRRLNLAGAVPGGAFVYLQTWCGRRDLAKVAQFFRIGVLGRHEVSKLNKRKLVLVDQALRRFRWIDRHEDWSYWQRMVKELPHGAISHFYYSKEDSLFHGEDYLRFAEILKTERVQGVSHQGHLLIQDFGYDLLKEDL